MSLDLVDYKEKLKEQEIASISDLKETRDKKEDQKVEKDDFAKRVENVNITYVTEGGEKKAAIVSKVMDHEARLRYDRVLQDLCGGLAFDTLPIETKNRYICMSRIVCQIVDCPDWVLKQSGEDLEFCYMLGGRLLDHESRFFRYSGRTGTENTSRPRFSIN